MRPFLFVALWSILMSDYIYILENERMPNLLKIGWTSRTPEERCSEISGSTGVPTSFIVVHKVEVSDGKSAEKEIHSLLSTERYANNREFFSISKKRAISAVDFVCTKYEPISNSATSLHYYSKAKHLIAQGKRKSAVLLLMQEGHLSNSEAEEMAYTMSHSPESPSGQLKGFMKGCFVLLLVMIAAIVLATMKSEEGEPSALVGFFAIVLISIVIVLLVKSTKNLFRSFKINH